jgi:hypothetical protein
MNNHSTHLLDLADAIMADAERKGTDPLEEAADATVILHSSTRDAVLALIYLTSTGERISVAKRQGFDFYAAEAQQMLTRDQLVQYADNHAAL